MLILFFGTVVCTCGFRRRVAALSQLEEERMQQVQADHMEVGSNRSGRLGRGHGREHMGRGLQVPNECVGVGGHGADAVATNGARLWALSAARSRKGREHPPARARARWEIRCHSRLRHKLKTLTLVEILYSVTLDCMQPKMRLVWMDGHWCTSASRRGIRAETGG